MPIASDFPSAQPFSAAENAEDGGASAINRLWVDSNAEGVVHFVCMWAHCAHHFEQLDMLEAHLDQHLSAYADAIELDQNPSCQIHGCQILVSSIEELMRHLKMHIFHANRLFCGLQYVRQKHPTLTSCNFVATSRLVYQGDPLVCEWNSCCATFVDINKFAEHVEHHILALCVEDRNEEQCYKCLWEDCRMEFRNKAHLRVHIQHHSGDKACACPFCGAFCTNTTRLLEHVTRRQSGDPSLVCQFCRKTFTSETMLRKHCKRHIKSHKCNFCPLVLDTPYELNRHVQTVHAKVRNHVCQYCGQSYFNRSDLNKHVEQHLNNAVHECTECGQKYKWAKQLREHMRRHSEDYISSPYRCHLCESRYQRGSALSKHLLDVHKVSVPAGFSRFQYKKCQDGLFRLQTVRYVRNSAALGETDIVEAS